MAGLPKVNINITGGIARPNLNKDGVSGYVFYNDNIANLNTFSSSNRISKFTNLNAVEMTGILPTSTNFKYEYYQLKEHFRAGGAEIYVGIFDVPVGSGDYSELNDMHLYSNGDIKIYAVCDRHLELDETNLALVNAQLVEFEEDKKPAIAIYAANTGTLTLNELPDLRALSADLPYVSVVIGQDTKNEALDFKLLDEGLSNIGIVVGTLSQAKVNENILNVGKYNYSNGVSMVEPGLFINYATADYILIGSQYIDSADLDALNDKGYIFWRYFPNLQGTYLSNDNNCVDVTDTFNSIHIVRTRNKVFRLLDKALSYLIGSNVLFNGDGTMRTSSINVYENAVSKELQEMINSSEISAFSVYIDPAQNVLSTKEVVIDVAIVPTESSDFITLNVSFVASL